MNEPIPTLLCCGLTLFSCSCAHYVQQGLPSMVAVLDLRQAQGSCRYQIDQLVAYDLMVVRPWLHSSHTADWACVMFEDNIVRDSTSNSCLPDAQHLLNDTYSTRRTIHGTMSYMGLAELPYHYDISPDRAGLPVVSVRVSLVGPLAQESENIRHMRRRLNEAAQLWTDAAPNGHTWFRFRNRCCD